MELAPALLSSLLQLSRACRILELEGHGDFSLGHLSLRDPEGRGFWLKRNRMGLGEIMGPEDFVLVDFDGKQLAGAGGMHSEWTIHSEVFRLRPDVEVVAHSHPLYASICSATTGPILPYTLDADYFIDIPRHDAEVALIKSKEEGLALARSLADGFAVFIANHGIMFCGTSIAHSTCIGVFLERACRAHVIGSSAGFATSMPSRGVREKRKSQMMTPIHVEHTWNYLNRKLDHCLAGPRSGQQVVFR